MFRFASILLIALAFFCNILSSQELRFEQFTTKDGLLSDEVYNMLQDKKGYIWLFTKYGAMKYNGKSFEPVLQNLPFKESVIYAAYEKRNDGRIWVANSQKNIYEVRNDSAFLVRGLEEGTSIFRDRAQEISQLYVDDSLNIYAKSYLFTFKFLRGTNYTVYDLGKWFAGKPDYEYILSFKDEYMSVFNTSFLPAFLSRNRISLSIVDMLGNRPSVPIVTRGKDMTRHFKKYGNDVYFIFNTRLIRRNSQNVVKEVNINEEIVNFVVGKNRHVWVATFRNGLYELDEHDSIVNHYFPGVGVNDVLMDNSGGLWVSTNGEGLYHCKNFDCYFFSKNSYLGKAIRFIKPINGKVFFGTNDVVVYVMDGDKITTVPKDMTNLNDIPLDLALTDEKGYLVSYSGHSEFLPVSFGKERAKSYGSMPSCKPFCVLKGPNDTVFLLGRNRLDIIDKNAVLLKQKIFPSGIGINVRASDMELRGKELLIASDNGVVGFKNGGVFLPEFLKPTFGSKIAKIRKDGQKKYWFCSSGNGLYCLTQGNQLIHYPGYPDLPDNIINDVYFIGDGKLLLCTSKGLYYYPKGLKGGYRRIFSGDVSTACIYNKKILVGSESGLAILRQSVLENQDVVGFNIRSVSVNSSPKNLTQIAKLSHGEKSIEFQFDIMCYSGETFALKYNLSGPFSDSGVVKSDKLNFIELRPGDYTLSVQPVGNVLANQQLIQFSIMPAFWQTSWFFFATVFTGMFLVILVAWLLLRYYQTRALKKSEAEKLIAEYRLIALKAQINPHFMSNCIAAIQHLVIQNKVNEANEYLAKFSYLVRQVLNLSNKSLVPLKEELEIIELYLSLEQLRFDKIAVKLEVDKDIDVESTFIPPLLSQPIIENAIWHGLLALKASRVPLLQVLVQRQNGMIRMVLEDNGVGRTLKKNGIGNSRESRGIAITRQRIENLTFVIGENMASLLYEDLLDSRGEPAGTRVVIVLPDNLHL